MSRSASAGISFQQEWNESSQWKVCEPGQLPVDFPLERTHREVSGVEASVVAARISKALRLLSVDAVYDGEKAKVKCTTTDMVSFRIRLYSGGEPGEGLPVVVEVQRRGGSVHSFMSVCRKILDGAEGVEIEAETQPARKKLPPCMKVPISSMKCLQGAGPRAGVDSLSNGELTKSIELLGSNNKDTNLLGLESLCLLTDPLKTRPDVALRACKAVLLEDAGSVVREELVATMRKDSSLHKDSSQIVAERSRHFALILLSNSLLLTSEDGCLADAIESQKWFADFLVPSLLEEVKSCGSSANNAYEAACGLTSLAKCCDASRTLMEKNSASQHLRTAHKVGSQTHELLASEAERCLAEMGSSL